ncbi:MAG: sensor signal transduction histidine kinase [bacterium]|nr:sensor signal transduction histidine kinase [bacterium]
MVKRSDSDVRALERELARVEAERAEMFERLRQLETENTDRAMELFTMAAHELHTPLQSLLVGTDSMLLRLEATADEVPREWLLERIAQQQRTLVGVAELMRTLLSVAQLRAGTLAVVRETVDLAKVARDVVARHTDELAWARCAIAVEEENAAIGCWDQTRLDVVLTSLLSNAIKFGAGHPISVVVDSDEASASIVVRDSGIGIGVADQARIFERFERGGAPAEIPGFGLGLWLARSLLRDLGGKIDVTSMPGAGAAFTVRLPRAA